MYIYRYVGEYSSLSIGDLHMLRNQSVQSTHDFTQHHIIQHLIAHSELTVDKANVDEQAQTEAKGKRKKTLNDTPIAETQANDEPITAE